MMRSILLAAAAALAVTAAPAAADHHGATAHDGHGAMHERHMALQAALASETRAEDRARDGQRHPFETLEFMGVEPGQKVGEYAPGGGWYSRVLAPYLGTEGKLVGLMFNSAATPFDQAARDRIDAGAPLFPRDAAQWTGLPESRFAGYTLGNVPDGETGTFDRILVIRMMHNLMRWNMADTELATMRTLLKDDGMLGIVQHRAPADAPYAMSDGNTGYLRQADVIAFVESQGFELVGMSEVNANPADSADYEQGVWELPPTLRTQRDDLRAVGESDRMTLLFRKRG